MPASAQELDLSALRAAAPELATGACYRVCYSGGLDSTTVLHALVQAGIAPLMAIHIHHGLQPCADAWVDHCQSTCALLGVPLDIRRVHVIADSGRGPEAAARKARYDALRDSMRPGDCLVMAHHRDDQAETLLLRLLRGAGVEGLAAMRGLRVFEPGLLWRPLLDLPRQSLHDWAMAQGLTWVEDPQNADMHFRRVWLRRDILPRLRETLPQTEAMLARSASVLASCADVLAEVAREDLIRVRRGDVLQVPELLRLSVGRRHNLLRAWLRTRGHQVPPAALLATLDREVLAARADAMPVLCFGDCELRRFRDALHVMPPLPPPPDHALRWVRGARLALPQGCGQLVANAAPATALTVDFTVGGERIRPAECAHRRRLRNLFQEAGMPPWWRSRIPLVLLDEKLAWVPDIAETGHWRKWCREHEWQVVWEPPTAYRAAMGL